jgi:hypothetical protein
MLIAQHGRPSPRPSKRSLIAQTGASNKAAIAFRRGPHPRHLLGVAQFRAHRSDRFDRPFGVITIKGWR